MISLTKALALPRRTEQQTWFVPKTGAQFGIKSSSTALRAHFDRAFSSLFDAINTPAAAGRMLLQYAGTFAEFENAMFRERTK